MLKVLNHPLAEHLVTHLRDKTTKPATFRTLTYHISLLLALEATRDLATKSVRVETPLESCPGRVLSVPLVVVPILRAGLGMVQPFTEIFPSVSIGYIGLERDHKTAIAHSYYCKLPPLNSEPVIIVDPMLATGGSAVKTITVLRENGARDIRFVCIVSAPEGVSAVEGIDPALPVFAAALDRELDERKYILPGLGDFGDRLYGT